MSLFHEIVKRINPYMQGKGFLLSRKNYYYIAADIAYCISFDAPGRMLYVTEYVMPLYIPCQSRYYTYGNRLNALQGVFLPTLQQDAINSIDEWCDILCQCIEKKIVPFYTQIGTPIRLIEQIEQKTRLVSTFFFCPEIDIERLKAYTYLYLRDQSKMEHAVKNYRNLLMASTFLADTARQKHLEEADSLSSLSKADEREVADFISNTITIMRKVL